MAEPEERTGRKSWGFRFTVAALTVLLLYPLSLGPYQLIMAWNLMPDGLSGPLCDFYSPLMWVYQHFPDTVGVVLERYMTWWAYLAAWLD